MVLYFSVQNWLPIRSFLVFWLLALLLYWPTAGAGFVTDTLGWFQTYKASGFAGLLTVFGDHSLHYVYHLIFFLLYKVFGFHGKGWMLVFTCLHAAVATLAFAFFRNLFSRLNILKGKWIAWSGSLLFLLSPYQTETLVWYACVHYLLCSVFVLLALRSFTDYLERGKAHYVISFYVWFVLSVFTLEIGFGLPLLVGAFALLLPLNGYKSQQRGKLLALFTVPSIAVVAAYFLLIKLTRGTMAGHYGAATHFNMDPYLLIGNFSKYCGKVFGLSAFWSYEKRMALHGVFENKAWTWVVLPGMALTVGLLFAFRHRLSAKVRLLIILFLAFGFALAPAVNLYYNGLTLIEGDRFTYLASVFGYMFLTLALVTLIPRLGTLLVFVTLVINLHYLRINAVSWKSNKEVSEALLKSFNWRAAPRIYLLVTPDNYRGAYMFRSFATDDYFSRRLDLQYGTLIEPNVINVLQYNMQSKSDGISVQRLTDNDLKLSFNQWGNWWWYSSVGAGNYETPDYSVTIGAWNVATIHFKNKQPGTVYLYQKGEAWQQVPNF